MSVRVKLPAHLRKLAQVDGEVCLDLPEPVTQRTVLDALEARHPVLRGTIRDHGTLRRRAFVRFFACDRSCRTTSRTPRCRPRWPRERSRSWW
jgi:molybdopterin synthase sulfur carrier subunit